MNFNWFLPRERNGDKALRLFAEALCLHARIDVHTKLTIAHIFPTIPISTWTLYYCIYHTTWIARTRLCVEWILRRKDWHAFFTTFSKLFVFFSFSASLCFVCVLLRQWKKNNISLHEKGQNVEYSIEISTRSFRFYRRWRNGRAYFSHRGRPIFGLL